MRVISSHACFGDALDALFDHVELYAVDKVDGAWCVIDTMPAECIDCGSTLHGTDSPHCPASDDREDS